MKAYKDCWIDLTADELDLRASIVSVVAFAPSSVINYIDNRYHKLTVNKFLQMKNRSD